MAQAQNAESKIKKDSSKVLCKVFAVLCWESMARTPLNIPDYLREALEAVPPAKGEEIIAHETEHFWVKNVGKRGFEIYETGPVYSTLAMRVGRGPGPRLGLERAIAECEKRENLLKT